jgi:pimeloyl-ACP methyl ester carboxylesterase
MVTETDLALADGRTLHVYDTLPGGGESLAVFWHHGTPNIGSPPGPLLPLAGELGVRFVSHDRPGYGGSTELPGRSVASVAADVAAVANALGIERFAVMGHSGGGPHALACAALLPERVQGVVSGSGLAPIDAAGLDWFAGMAAAGAGELRAAVEGRAVLEQVLSTGEFDPEQFTPADHAALEGEWSWLISVVEPAQASGIGPMVDDDLAYVAPWGFDVTAVRAPALFLHGGADRVVPSAHGEWLAAHCPGGELWLRPDDGHISVLTSAADALEWLVAAAH